MLKRIAVIGLVMAIGLSTATATKAEENVGTAKEAYAAQFSVDSRSSLEEKYDEYDVPAEVKEYVEDVLADNKNAKVTVYSPDVSTSAGGISTFAADTGKWGKKRTYNGFTLKDWKVNVQNGFNMTDINATGKFKAALAIYVGSQYIDKIIPYGSAGIALADFCYNNSYIKFAGSGDKVQCAPVYTAITKFTYVKSGGNWVLGARTHKAKLKNINWYFYCKKKNVGKYKTMEYNKVFKSPNYSNPDPVAIVSTGIGGQLDGSIKLKVKNVLFSLE